jgi:hypothetical protein
MFLAIGLIKVPIMGATRAARSHDCRSSQSGWTPTRLTSDMTPISGTLICQSLGVFGLRTAASPFHGAALRRGSRREAQHVCMSPKVRAISERHGAR